MIYAKWPWQTVKHILQSGTSEEFDLKLWEIWTEISSILLGESVTPICPGEYVGTYPLKSAEN